MQSAVSEGEGTMAAILGLSDEQIILVCENSAGAQVVSPVNFNAPGQVVIAGHTVAVKRAIEIAKTKGARKAILLPVSVPAHCALMQPAAEKMASLLANVTISTPTIPVIHNVDVTQKAAPAEIRAALTAQLYNPVRWTPTIEKMVAEGVTLLFESGPGKVLTGLNKRISRQTIAKPIMDSQTLEQALQALEA
jgi:[acyl-carrier-protein] S-malonyltransferase